MLGRVSILVFGGISGAAGATGAPATFHRDVLPVLQKHCQSCHRAGEIGPMPLLTYQQARPWAKAIRTAVVQRRMPPWHADSRYGHYANNRSLTAAEIQTISDWAEAGAPEGAARHAPPARIFSDGWRIGKPDMVIETPVPYKVAATGIINYQFMIVPSGFKEDRWVRAVELRPGNRAVVHHAVVYAREPGSDYASTAPMGEWFDIFKHVKLKARPEGQKMFGAVTEPEHLQVYAPGADPVELKPGQARLIKAGSDIIFEMHYTTTGAEATDRSSVGLIFSKEPPVERVHTIRINNGAAITIPPGEPDYRMQSQVYVDKPLRVVAMQPHMHLRGKSMEFRAIYPTGESEVLLSVPRYDFHWQTTYYLKEPRTLPKGTILICSASWDNSANNAKNPNPQRRVVGGFQSEDEMMAGFVEFGFSPELKDLTFFRDAPPEAAAASPRAAR